MNINNCDDRGIELLLRRWSGAMTAKEVTGVIHVALSTTYRYAKKGVLPKLPLPGVVRFDGCAVADVLFGGKK